MAYSEKQIETIFKDVTNQISEGKSLREVLRQTDKPNRSTFYEWISKDEDKSDQYVRACNDRSELIFDEIIEIADATADDIIINDEGKVITNHNVIQRDRLRVDARKWALSKMNPKKYGDKQAIEMDIKDEKPFTFEIIDGRKN
tara:strand:+ start:265 stop:696 length:432 start_codon:yes stop_codon:yes gene_type:complete